MDKLEEANIRIKYLLDIIDEQDQTIQEQLNIIQELKDENIYLKNQIDQHTDWRNFVQ